MGPIVFSSLAFALALSASAAPLKPRQLSGACMPTFNNSLVNIQSTSDNTLYWVAEYVTNSGFSNVTVTVSLLVAWDRLCINPLALILQNAFGPTSEEYGDWNITVDQSGFFQISWVYLASLIDPFLTSLKLQKRSHPDSSLSRQLYQYHSKWTMFQCTISRQYFFNFLVDPVWRLLQPRQLL